MVTEAKDGIPGGALARSAPFGACASIADLYVRNCRWKGARDLFVDDHGGRFTGTEALDSSLRFASALRNASLQPGDAIVFLCASSASHIVAWFGALAGGYVTANLHTRDSTAAQLAERLSWLGARMIIHDKDYTDVVQAAIDESGLPIRNLVLDDAENGWSTFVRDAEPLDYELERPGADQVACVILSSGTTGKPKGVMHSQASLLACALSGQTMLGGIHRHDTIIIPMAPSFAGWVMFVLPAMAGNARAVFLRRFDPAQVIDLVERERITILNMVPTMWRMVFAIVTPDRDFSSVRLTCVGGELPTPDDIRQITQRFCEKITTLYMAGESGTGCAVATTSEDLRDGRKFGSTGLPLAGCDLRFVDPAGSIEDEVPYGEVGEIVTTGSSIAMGYWADPELTAKKFVNGWWRSGDLGRLDEDGFLWMGGRADNVINTGGIKLHAEEVEAEILNHPDVLACAVVGPKDEKFGQRIEAWIVGRSENLDGEILKAYLKEDRQLSGHKVPKVFHFVDALPLGLTGKLDRRTLLEWSEAR